MDVNTAVSTFYFKHLHKKNKQRNTIRLPDTYHGAIMSMFATRRYQLQRPLKAKVSKFRTFVHIDDPRLRCLLCQYEHKIGVGHVREIQQYLTNVITSICVVTTIGISTIARRHLRDIGVPVTMFHTDQCQVNLPQHSLVPVHRKLTAEEKLRFTEKYNIANVPKLLTTDAIVNFNAWQPGDVIHIRRHMDKHQEPQNFYRVVT